VAVDGLTARARKDVADNGPECGADCHEQGEDNEHENGPAQALAHALGCN
jgi:hypothetical protein